MDDYGDSTAPSSLLSGESEPCLTEGGDGDEDGEYMNYDCNPLSLPEEEYIRKLVQEEACFGSDVVCSKSTPSWIKSARADAIDWILNARALHGFHHHTAYLSITYFDRFLSKRPVDEGKFWAIRLLWMACLSIAAKMVEERAPTLSGFQIEGCGFEGRAIQRMELHVLTTLGWRMRPITPFDYLPFFIARIWSESGSKGQIHIAVEFIFDITKEINLTDYPPSVIAAVAVLAAKDCKLTGDMVELKLGSAPSLKSLNHEDILSCYKQMQDMDKRRQVTPKSLVISQESSSPRHARAVVGLAKHSCTKRELAFDDSGMNYSVKKVHRR